VVSYSLASRATQCTHSMFNVTLQYCCTALEALQCTQEACRIMCVLPGPGCCGYWQRDVRALCVPM
jgi:hypothetical protein